VFRPQLARSRERLIMRSGNQRKPTAKPKAPARRRSSFVATLDRLEGAGAHLGALIGITTRTLQRWRAGADPGPIAKAFVRALELAGALVDLGALSRGRVEFNADVEARLQVSLEEALARGRADSAGRTK